MSEKTVLLEKVKRTAGCTACRHFRGLTCTAFPRGIPSEIQGGEVAHDKPYPGDHGIQWELNDVWAQRWAPELLEEVK